MAKPAFDVVSPRDRTEGGTHWHTIGAAWSNSRGGFTLELNSLPLPDREGKVKIMLFPFTEKDSAASTQKLKPAFDSDLDDDVPF